MCLATQNSVAFQKPKTVQWIPFCKGICGRLMELKTLLQRFPWQPACAYVFTHALTLFQRCAFCLADTLLQRCTLLQRLHPFAKVAPFCKGGPHKLISNLFSKVFCIHLYLLQSSSLRAFASSLLNWSFSKAALILSMIILYLLLLALLTSTMSLLFSPIVWVPHRYALSGFFAFVLLILSHFFLAVGTAFFFNAALGFFRAAGFLFFFGACTKNCFPELWVCLHISHELACVGPLLQESAGSCLSFVHLLRCHSFRCLQQRWVPF